MANSTTTSFPCPSSTGTGPTVHSASRSRAPSYSRYSRDAHSPCARRTSDTTGPVTTVRAPSPGIATFPTGRKLYAPELGGGLAWRAAYQCTCGSKAARTPWARSTSAPPALEKVAWTWPFASSTR